MYKLVMVVCVFLLLVVLFCDLEWIGENFSFAFFLAQLKLVLFVGIVTNGVYKIWRRKKMNNTGIPLHCTFNNGRIETRWMGERWV